MMLWISFFMQSMFFLISFLSGCKAILAENIIFFIKSQIKRDLPSIVPHTQGNRHNLKWINFWRKHSSGPWVRNDMAMRQKEYISQFRLCWTYFQQNKNHYDDHIFWMERIYICTLDFLVVKTLPAYFCHRKQYKRTLINLDKSLKSESYWCL